ncbi:MAG: hypothetical protein SA339_00930 [Methanomassiliicoccus sp.]|nr:hypothetical protein [Methanomassiliicoccus sp.]
MADLDIGKCQACGRKITKERSTDPGAPNVGYECSKCHQWVCGDCTDWNVSEKNNWVCSRCAGRTAPHKCGCD